MLEHLICARESDPLTAFMIELKREIEEDQAALERLIASVGADVGLVRQAGGWMMEKLSRLKIRVTGAEDGEMGLYLAFEVIYLGITGKHALWTALAAAAETNAALRILDYSHLQYRAIDQRDRVAEKRLALARTVLN